jgi:hypothetical protein
MIPKTVKVVPPKKYTETIKLVQPTTSKPQIRYLRNNHIIIRNDIKEIDAPKYAANFSGLCEKAKIMSIARLNLFLIE